MRNYHRFINTPVIAEGFARLPQCYESQGKAYSIKGKAYYSAETDVIRMVWHPSHIGVRNWVCMYVQCIGYFVYREHTPNSQSSHIPQGKGIWPSSPFHMGKGYSASNLLGWAPTCSIRWGSTSASYVVQVHDDTFMLSKYTTIHLWAISRWFLERVSSKQFVTLMSTTSSPLRLFYKWFGQASWNPSFVSQPQNRRGRKGIQNPNGIH